ncbi:unnamed protein product [Ilex paraguariensis]|uniref:Bidirectional sugar transporter SWEET n=1 Tax=Ilex paraguariensis TaxID=185542 RepID=A0ABC8TVQ6_9AQUA
MAIFDHHHPWLFTVGILGNIISICVYLAPMPTFARICKSKSTLGFQSLPYVVALFAAMLWMYYAMLKKDAVLLISINSFGCVVETIYVVIYLVYASKEAKNYTAKLLASMNVGLFSAIFLLTFFLVKSSHRVLVVGWICVAVSVSAYAAPLSIVFQVVRTRSVEFMPFTLSFFLTVGAVTWFGYGLLLRDICVALPNSLGFFLGLLQMLLYGIYRNAQKVVEEKKQQEHIMNIGMIGGGIPEIHSFDHSQQRGRDNHTTVAASQREEPGGQMNLQIPD